VVCICQMAIFQRLSSTVFRCNIQITNQVELRFRAVLGDGAGEVRFERVTG
jgi:hypothetical protein